MRGLRGMDAENEIAAGWVDFVIQFNREFESEHGEPARLGNNRRLTL
jgi:hypothetical protein